MDITCSLLKMKMYIQTANTVCYLSKVIKLPIITVKKVGHVEQRWSVPDCLQRVTPNRCDENIVASL